VAARRDGLYGRRIGKPLSPLRARMMEEALPRLALDLSVPAPADLSTLFPGAPKSVRLEIGFGGGEHLVAEASRSLETGFIGVEPFVNGMAKMVTTIVDRGLSNVRLHAGDATPLLDWLPAASLERVDLLYPDPWPKKRHWKRRFVSKANLARLARALRPGGIFRVASDIPDYVTWTLAHAAQSPDFAWTAERARDWEVPFADWPGTRYEAKALAAGRTPTYLTFRRA
jgi:tRNA (guanine-N7-)-methyltransferase